MGGDGKDTRQKRERRRGERSKSQRGKSKEERRYRRSWPVLLVRHWSVWIYQGCARRAKHTEGVHSRRLLNPRESMQYTLEREIFNSAWALRVWVFAVRLSLTVANSLFAFWRVWITFVWGLFLRKRRWLQPILRWVAWIHVSQGRRWPWLNGIRTWLRLFWCRWRVATAESSLCRFR